jgi:hypothetical protein
MSNIFFRKVRLFFVIFFFIFSTLGFITYLNYTDKLSPIDNHNSVLNFFKPHYQHSISINNGFINEFDSLTERIKTIYVQTDGLNQASKTTLDKLINSKINNFIFDNDYYFYPLPGETDNYRLCKVHAKIMKNFFKENKVVFCDIKIEIDTYNILIISNKKKINFEDMNNFFVDEYKRIHKQAFDKIRQINPNIKKDGEIFLQIIRDSKIASNISSQIFELDSESKLFNNNLQKKIIYDSTIFAINLMNERYEIINNLLSTDLNNFSREAIQFQSTKQKTNHLFIISILLFGFSLMISFVITFIISANKLYKQSAN